MCGAFVSSIAAIKHYEESNFRKQGSVKLRLHGTDSPA